MLLRLVFLTLFLSCSGGARAEATSVLMPGEVIEGHAKLEAKCSECHVKFDKEAQTKLCKDCHKEVGADVLNQKGFHGKLKEKECKECHTDHKGRDAHIVIFDQDKFDHAQTEFQLKGGHLGEKVKCKNCHEANKKFRESPKTCNGCHKKDDKHKGSLGIDCAKCHVEKDWKTTNFDHDKTDYKLLGKHVDVKCKSCHIENKYKDTPTQCNACHKKDDKHKGSFGPKCETCHVEKSWKEILFDHDKKTKYPLLGKHRPPAKCTSCHKGDLYKDKLKMTCDSCHTRDDKHKGNFGPKCESCHVERDWKEILFDHDKKTKYPLLGKHRPPAKCTSCHKGDLYKDKLQSNCYACHQNDDKHKGQEGKKCETCHDEQSWNKAKFDHRSSHFPLTGKHVLTECKKCHAAPTYKDAKSGCWPCHEKQDKDTHKRRLGMGCETCHNTRDWKVWDFDHEKTDFKLGGGHKNIGCYDCHQKPMNKKVTSPATCASCHEKDDEHNGDYGHLCEPCHEVSSWKKIKSGGRVLQ